MASYLRTLAKISLAVGATAVVGTIATDPDSKWYKSLDKPEWQPPRAAFPIAWTTLYALIAHTSADTLATLSKEAEAERSRGILGEEGAAELEEEAKKFRRSLGTNLVLNAGWTFLFFRSENPPLAAVGAGALALSTFKLNRRAAKVRRRNGLLLAPYSAWTAFATALSTDIARRNPS